MTYKPASIPSLPTDTSPAMRQFLTSIKEALEVRVNHRGNALDASPTFQDLLDTGILKPKEGLTTIGGRQYTAEQLLGVVQATIPTWITSDTAPAAPTGLTVGSDSTNTILTWNASTSDTYAKTEIWRANNNNISTRVLIGSTSGISFTDGLPLAGQAYYYWIRDVAYNFLAGPFNDINGASTFLGPEATAVFVSFVGADVDISWPSPTSNIAVSLYRIEVFGDTWQTLDTVSGNSHRFKVGWEGDRLFRIIAIDIRGNESPSYEFTISVAAPTAPPVDHYFNGEHVVFSWTSPLGGTLPVDRYEVYIDSVTPANLLAEQYATVFRTKITGWSSPNRTYFVRAIDTANNVGAAQASFVFVSTGEVVGLTSQVIDNNVLFRWANAPGSLPIITYELRRGDVWDTATVVGKKDGGFTTVFEAPQTTVTFTYWLAAVDTGGFYGTPVSTSATVSQPPDYVLADNFSGNFVTGAKTNAVVGLTGGLIIPVDTTKTWQTHFTSRSWASPQAQVAAGYLTFIQPSVSTGSFSQVYDAGTALPAMKITVSFLETVIASNGGTPTTTVTIEAALNAAFTSNLQTFTGVLAYALNFRYVRVTITVTGSNDFDIVLLENLQVKLDTKLKSQTGTISAVSTDTGGTVIYLTEDKTASGAKTFIDVDSITVSALSTTPVTAIYDFVDANDPLSFKVLLFNSSGTRVSGAVSYQVRGF
jgi:hypothetical protein